MANTLKRLPRQQYIPLETETALDVIHLDFDREGYICLGHKGQIQLGGKWSQVWHQVEEAHQACVMLQGASDCYVSMGSFKSRDRRTMNLSEISSVWVDLDIYKCGIKGNPTDILDRILTLFPWMPCPTLLVDSGRGLYLIWALSQPITCDQLPEWSCVIETLVEELSAFGADPAAVDGSRVLRVPNSINSKSDKSVQVFQVGEVIKFSALKKCLGPIWEARRIKPEVPEIRTGKRKALPEALKGKQWSQKVCEDLERLAAIRGGKYQDYRARALFCYAVQVCWFSNTVDQVVATCDAFVTEHFADAGRYQSEKRLTTVIHRMANKDMPTLWNGKRVPYRYRMETKTVMEWLEITREEQKQLKYLIGPEEKMDRLTQKRRDKGVISRDEYMEQPLETRARALDLFDQGMTEREVAKSLDISPVSAHRHHKTAPHKSPPPIYRTDLKHLEQRPYSQCGYYPDQIKQMIDSGMRKSDIARALGISKQTAGRLAQKAGK